MSNVCSATICFDRSQVDVRAELAELESGNSQLATSPFEVAGRVVGVRLVPDSGCVAVSERPSVLYVHERSGIAPGPLTRTRLSSTYPYPVVTRWASVTPINLAAPGDPAAL